MSLPDIFRELKCSARIYDYNACYRKIEDPRVTWRQETDGDLIRSRIETPVGIQTTVIKVTPSSHARICLKREIESEEEMKVAIWRAVNTTWEWDEETYRRVQKEWGNLGAPTMYVPRVNIQDLYINTMGVEKAIYALADYPDTVEAYFRALDECHDRLMDVINESPIEIINFGDNVHSGTLPPKLFREWVLPVYQWRCEKLHRAGKFVHSHWDGDTKPLLPLARETGLDGIEAITPWPQGDVTLEEIKDGLEDDLFLIDGIPAIYFDELYPITVLEECTRRLIELFAPKLILGISDEISSTGDINRIRRVGGIVEEYNESV